MRQYANKTKDEDECTVAAVAIVTVTAAVAGGTLSLTHYAQTHKHTNTSIFHAQ